MITQAGENAVRQVCNCGSDVLVSYDLIQHKKQGGVSQLVFPICQSCETRIEFIFIGPNMTRPELQMLAQMQNKGLIK